MMSFVVQDLLLRICMARKLRYMRQSKATFEITTRTLQGRLLLRPSKELNAIILGIIGRALQRYPVMLHLVVVASNHIHMIITTESLKLLSDFMRHVNSNIAREAGLLHQWKEKFWGRRYSAFEILDDAKLINRAIYLLSHGCKEGLVMRPSEWPGVNCIDAVTRGKTLKGIWYNRTKQYEAGRAGQPVSRTDFGTKYEIPLTPLPCFADLSTGQQRAQYRAMIGDIEQHTSQQLIRAGRRVMGAKKVLAQSPHRKPNKVKRSPAPLCHCSDPEERRRYRDDFRWFTTLYKQASKRLRAGEEAVRFPENCFPPPLAFSGIGGVGPPG